jgi:hypothetical protein
MIARKVEARIEGEEIPLHPQELLGPIRVEWLSRLVGATAHILRISEP